MMQTRPMRPMRPILPMIPMIPLTPRTLRQNDASRLTSASATPCGVVTSTAPSGLYLFHKPVPRGTTNGSKGRQDVIASGWNVEWLQWYL